MEKIKVGIVGCGNISGTYMENLSTSFDITEVHACADLNLELAKSKAEEFGIKNVYTVDELMADEKISIVVNLTIPKVHFEVCNTALDAGKNVYVEKPLSFLREDGKKLISKANKKGLLLGGAPDTFLGGGLQTCRKLIDEGWIGRPVAATAFMMGHGPESWHPNPDFFYKIGGGPMFDMGPYYITALVSLLGPVARVTGSVGISFAERTIGSGEKRGKKIDVEIPTHIAGVMDFKSGVIATLVTSFDVWEARLPRIEIYGSEGSLSIPDPNSFGGPVLIRRYNQNEWKEIPLTHGYSDKNSRGIGVADMAHSLITGRANRANGDLAYHVLDIMHGFHDASRDGKHYILDSTCERPSALQIGLIKGKLD